MQGKKSNTGQGWATTPSLVLEATSPPARPFENAGEGVRTPPLGSMNHSLAPRERVAQGQRTLEALARSEAHLARAQELAQLGSWELDLQTNELVWSAQTYIIYGFDKGTYVPCFDQIITLFHDDDREQVQTRLQKLLVEQGSLEVTARFFRSDGQVRWGSFAATAVIGENGMTTSVIGTVHDISERKEAEHALRDSDAQARAIIEASPDAFVRLDVAGIVTEWSAQAETLLGWTRSEAIGRSLTELAITKQGREAYDYWLAQQVSLGPIPAATLRTELQARNRSGDIFPIELTVVNTSINGTVFLNGFIRDIRERIAVEERLRHVQKMDALGQLTGGVAHDFNNLLAITIGNLDLLEEHLNSDDDAKMLLVAARDASLRGVDLTSRLLLFARQQTLNVQSTNINTLVSEYAQLLRRLLGDNVSLKTDLADRLWHASVDKGQLEAAITNLVTNARDSLREGGPITISSRNETLEGADVAGHTGVAPGDYVALEVSDVGHGMSSDVIKRALEPFFTTKEEGKGTGLGLSTVFGFVKQSGGHLRISSEPNKGTKVTLLLPRASSAPYHAGTVEPSIPRAADGETVLIVEDDPSLRRMITIQLKSLGYQTVEANDGRSAMDILERNSRIDLLITDLVMPGGLSGADLAEKAPLIRPGVKLMFMSGYPDRALEKETQLDPRIVFIRKPFRKSDLANKVRIALERRF